MSIRIALVGNPNCGKTTLFNSLTGLNQFVGNWPGVTVEKKEGRLKNCKDAVIVDLPGIYSLSPYTIEEVIARNYLVSERPDAILNIIDGSNIERNLYLTTQLSELGIPIVVAVNMMDIVEKNSDIIDFDKLKKSIGCDVVAISALKGAGVNEAAQKVLSAAKGDSDFYPFSCFPYKVEEYIDEISSRLDSLPQNIKRFYSVKLFEKDSEINKSLPDLPDVSDIISRAESELDDDTESIVTNERYNYISRVIKKSYKKKNRSKLTVSDRIDRIVTDRFLALPIFAAVMFIVYYVSITTVGAIATDWMNDGVFGDGWHLFGIGSPEYEEAFTQWENEQFKVGSFIDAARNNGFDTDAFIENLNSENPDSAVTEDFIFLTKDISTVVDFENDGGQVEKSVLVTSDDFKAALDAEEPEPDKFGIWIPGVPVLFESALSAINTADWLSSLILDGIVSGVGAVIGFVPQMLVLFLFLSFLESCGYMARIAFIMDRIFRKFGLSGKSFIPMLVGSGCSIPGIMASRTIENESDRKMTIITTSFIPCGAKLPVIALIAGALFPESSWVAPSAYFVGIASIIISGVILRKTKMFSGDCAPFVMELPAYRMPLPGNLLRSMWERGWSFIRKAGTVILISSIVLWFVQSFEFRNGVFEMTDDLNSSLLASFGNLIAPVFVPLGWGDWRAAVATITGLIAKENIVSTFGILFNFAEVSENGTEIWGSLSSAYTAVAAYSFLVFNLLCAPCFAAVGAIKREMNSAKWTWFAIGYQTLFAYCISFCVYQLGNLFTSGELNFASIIAFAVVGMIVYLLFRSKRKETVSVLKSENKELILK